jgi:hypothetical protein
MKRYLGSAAILALFACTVLVTSPRAQWIKDGVPVRVAEWNQELRQLVPDGMGGAIISYDDYGGGAQRLCAQKISATGSLLWGTEGAVLGPGAILGCSVSVPDGSGGAIFTWSDSRSGVVLVYAQRLDANGSALWAAGGVRVCTSEDTQVFPSITPDGAGGAVIVWRDWRDSCLNAIYTQRISPDGSLLWPSEGVALTTCGAEAYRLVPDESGGAIFIWGRATDPHGSGGGFDLYVYAQRVGADGKKLWREWGVPVCTILRNETDYCHCYDLAADGMGGAVIAWNDRSCGALNVNAQRVDANGCMQWGPGGISLCSAGGSRDYRAIASDGAGGAVLVWNDYRGGSDGKISAQKVDADGSLPWGAGGLPVCTASEAQAAYNIIPDGSGGTIMVWTDNRGGTPGLSAQRMNASGLALWRTDGVPVCTAGGNIGICSTVSDGAGGAIIGWSDDRNNYPPDFIRGDVYAMRVTASGDLAATLLQSHSAAFTEAGITIEWTLFELDAGAAFFVERAAGASAPFIELPSDGITANGLSFLFVDADWESEAIYRYRVGYELGGERTTLFETDPITTPSMPITLSQNSPNPFNPSTTISFYLPSRGVVALSVYDVTGSLVARLVNEERSAGRHSVLWNGTNQSGERVSSGIYFCRLQAGKEIRLRKMALLR